MRLYEFTVIPQAWCHLAGSPSIVILIRLDIRQLEIPTYYLDLSAYDVLPIQTRTVLILDSCGYGYDQ
jgi:hypothetical protein